MEFQGHALDSYDINTSRIKIYLMVGANVYRQHVTGTTVTTQLIERLEPSVVFAVIYP